RAERGGIEVTKGRGNLRRRAAFLRLVGVSATERGGERYAHPHPRRATARLGEGLRIRRAKDEMAATKPEGELARARAASCSSTGRIGFQKARRLYDQRQERRQPRAAFIADADVAVSERESRVALDDVLLESGALPCAPARRPVRHAIEDGPAVVAVAALQ